MQLRSFVLEVQVLEEPRSPEDGVLVVVIKVESHWLKEEELRAGVEGNGE